MTTIQEAYRRLHPRSARLHQEAVKTFPSGVTHDIRHLTPFPLYVDHAQGSRKWDVDGNEIVDYVMGHGALFLGHAYPDITRAVQEQAAKGTSLDWSWCSIASAISSAVISAPCCWSSV